jgi:hypothetical protein
MEFQTHVSLLHSYDTALQLRVNIIEVCSSEV